MATLHIEHPVRDFDMWSTAFERFAEVRRHSGVRHQEVRRPVDDPAYVVVDLEFDTVEQATGFLAFLEAKVWSSPDASPALIGTPRTAVLESVSESNRTSSAGGM